MLELEVQLPQQGGRKKIEWNKNGDPTFEELKTRLQQCGVPDDWCVEVLRGSKFFAPDLHTHIHGPKITVRAAPLLGHSSYPSITSTSAQSISNFFDAHDTETSKRFSVNFPSKFQPLDTQSPLYRSKFSLPQLPHHHHNAKQCMGVGDLRTEEEHPGNVQWTQWMKAAFEKVVSHVGRVYLVDTTKEEEVRNPRSKERCVGTVGLMDVHGESICALHCIQSAVENPGKYKIYVAFPNYHKGCFSFEAKIRAVNADVDVCVVEPVQSLKKPFQPTTYLDLATDVREGDVVYCFFFPDDPRRHITPPVLQKLMLVEKKHLLRDGAVRRAAELPSIIPGTVCFSEWMQGVVVYERPPDSNGGILVSRSGRVKGIHVKAFSCEKLREKMNSENPADLRIVKKICRKMGSYAPSDSIPVFVPPHGLVELLELEGGCELLQAAIRQNKEKVKLPAPKHPKPSSRSGRSTRSICPSPYGKSRPSNKRRSQ